MLQMQPFLRNSNQHVDGYSSLDLRLHLVLAKTTLMQMLLDPLEEQLHLPALAVKIGNHLQGQRRVVGQKHQALCLVVLGHYPA